MKCEAEIMEISSAELVELKEKVENNNLDQEAIRRLIAVIDTYSYIHLLIAEKNITINKLNRLLYGTSGSSEKSARIRWGLLLENTWKPRTRHPIFLIYCRNNQTIEWNHPL